MVENLQMPAVLASAQQQQHGRQHQQQHEQQQEERTTTTTATAAAIGTGTGTGRRGGGGGSASASGDVVASHDSHFNQRNTAADPNARDSQQLHPHHLQQHSPLPTARGHPLTLHTASNPTNPSALSPSATHASSNYASSTSPSSSSPHPSLPLPRSSALLSSTTPHHPHPHLHLPPAPPPGATKSAAIEPYPSSSPNENKDRGFHYFRPGGSGMAEPSPTAASTPSTPLTAAGAAAGGGGGAAGAGASPSLRWWLGESPLVLVVLYFCLNLGITIYNKAILKLFHFNFPWLLTAIHALLSCAGASLVLGNNSTYSARSATDASGKFSSDGTTYASPILPLVAPSSTSSSTPGAHQPSSSSSSSSSSSLPPPAHKSLFPHLRFRVSSLAVLPLRLLSRLIRALLVAFLHIASPTYSAAAASSTSSSSSTTTDHPHHPPHATAAAAPPREVLAILGFSVLYTVNIAVSNVSLNMVSLPFHQIVRSTSPAVTLLLERALYRLSSRGSRPPPPVEPATVGALGLVIAGVALATVGEYEFTAAGLAATLTGVVLSSLKGIATHRLLTTTNSTTTTGLASLTPLDLLWRMSALACIQCVLVSWASGELASYQAFLVRLASSPAGGGLTVPGLYAVLVLNGVMAFLLNYVSFAANRRVGALSMTVAGNVKQSMTILLSVWIFGYLISWVNGCGILVTLVGGAWYSAIGVRKKLKASARKEQDLGLSTTRKD